jgi:hypothetical protein
MIFAAGIGRTPPAAPRQPRLLRRDDRGRRMGPPQHHDEATHHRPVVRLENSGSRYARPSGRPRRGSAGSPSNGPSTTRSRSGHRLSPPAFPEPVAAFGPAGPSLTMTGGVVGLAGPSGCRPPPTNQAFHPCSMPAWAVTTNVRRVGQATWSGGAAPALVAFAADAGAFSALCGDHVGVAGVGVAPA